MSEQPNQGEHELAAWLPRLQRFFMARGWGHEAEDLASEVTVRVVAAIRKGEAIQHLGAFCLGTARMILLERYRKPPDPVSMPEGWDPAAPEVEAPNQDRIICLRDCLQELEVKDQSLMLEYYADGKGKSNRAALAARLGVTLNAVHIKASRLRGQVRQCVEARLQAIG